MHLLKLILLLFCLNFYPFSRSFALINPSPVKKTGINASNTDPKLAMIAHFTPKEIEHLTGHKLSLKEKIILKLLRHKIAKSNKLNATDNPEKLKRKSLWAKWLGIGSLIALFVPGVGILSIPAAIIAIVFGTNLVKNTEGRDQKNARQGITFGIITLSLLVFFVLLALAFLSIIGFK